MVYEILLSVDHQGFEFSFFILFRETRNMFNYWTKGVWISEMETWPNTAMLRLSYTCVLSQEKESKSLSDPTYLVNTESVLQ